MTFHRLPPALLAFATCCAVLPAAAQYKVVGPDGSVTYTDRPPANPDAKVTALTRRSGAPTAAEGDLPFELRQTAARYPVTLYASSECVPCDNARQMLQQRGVPYAERRIASEEDAQALERIVGARTVPSLTIGAQTLRGFSAGDWGSYLDAAGYPHESQLPRNWQPPLPTPLTERAVAAARAASQPAPAAPAAPAPEAPKNDSGIRF